MQFFKKLLITRKMADNLQYGKLLNGLSMSFPIANITGAVHGK